MDPGGFAPIPNSRLSRRRRSGDNQILFALRVDVVHTMCAVGVRFVGARLAIRAQGCGVCLVRVWIMWIRWTLETLSVTRSAVAMRDRVLLLGRMLPPPLCRN